MRKPILAVGMLAFAALLIGGCYSPADNGVRAQGFVTVNGRPLSGAVITLEPIRATRGPNASAAVFDGRFEFVPDAGLVGGNYLVRISLLPAEIRNTLPAKQRAAMPPADAVISPQFDARSTLRCQLKSNENNQLVFEVDYL